MGARDWTQRLAAQEAEHARVELAELDLPEHVRRELADIAAFIIGRDH